MTGSNFSMAEYWKHVSKQLEPRHKFKDGMDFDKWHRQLLVAVKEVLGSMPQAVDLNPRVEWEIEEDGLIKRRVLLDLEEHMSVAALVYIPKAAMAEPAGAILCNHGHSSPPFPHGKDHVMGVRLESDPERAKNIALFNYDYGLQMAKHGYVTMAIDWRGFGERSDGGMPYPGRDACNVNFIIGSLMGRNLLALNVFDAMRCLDYLESLDCVDSQRIGAMGLSFGGTMTTWISLMDERIKAADIICYSCLFDAFAISRGNFCGSQIVPGLYDLCDVPELQGLIAPRPLLVEIGLQDDCFLYTEALECSKRVEAIYKAASAGDSFEVDVFNGGHQFNGRKAFDFFDKHLKA